MNGKKPGIFTLLLLLLIVFVLLTGLSACGRKGDPILITPDEKAASDRSFIGSNESGNSE